MLQDLYPNISLGTEYAMQLHGYMALPNQTSTLQINHAVGQATLHLGHCLFQVSDVPGLCAHRRVRANEVLSALVGRFDSQAVDTVHPLVVSEGARADIRLRSETHDPVYIGDAGGLWMLYEPRGVHISWLSLTSSCNPLCLQ